MIVEISKRRFLLITFIVVASVLACLVVPHTHCGKLSSDPAQSCAVCQFHNSFACTHVHAIDIAQPQPTVAAFSPSEDQVVDAFFAASLHLRAPPTA
jgi:hypothetical protein